MNDLIRLTRFTKISFPLLISCILLCACTSGKSDAPEKKDSAHAEAITRASVPPDTTYRRFMADTSLRFQTTEELTRYRVQRDKAFREYKERALSKAHNSNLEFELDSVGYHNQDLFAYLIFKFLEGTEKNQKNLFLVLFNHDLSKIITPEERLAMFNQFPASVRESQQGKDVLKKITLLSSSDGNRAVQALSTTLKKPDGSAVALKDLLSSSHKKYLLVFGASWCGPCRYENRLLKKRLSLIDTTQIKIIGISVDESETKWLKMLKDDDCPWTQVKDAGGVEAGLYKLLQVKTLPGNLLLDENKMVIDEQTNIELILSAIIPR